MSTNNIESSVTGQPMDKAEGWGYGLWSFYSDPKSRRNSRRTPHREGTNDPQPKQHPKEVDALVLDVYLGGTTVSCCGSPRDAPRGDTPHVPSPPRVAPAGDDVSVCVLEALTLPPRPPQEAHLLPPKVEEKIRELSIPGVRWGQKWDVEEVAFGVKKIRIQALIDNMSQETQTVQDAVSRVYGVKSVEFVAFTKA
jgi:translation elongation factor EF-1beta